LPLRSWCAEAVTAICCSPQDINIQNAGGKVKPYQVRQVLAALIDRLESKNG